MKLVRLARAYRETAMTKPAHVALVGCVTRNSIVGNDVDGIVRGMVKKMVDARDRLIFLGVPKPAISGHLPLMPVPIVQNVVQCTVKDSALRDTFPGKRTGVPEKIDTESAVSGKVVIDPFSDSEDKRQSHHVATQIEVTIWDGKGNKSKLPASFSASLNVSPNGIHEVGAEFVFLKQKLKNQIFWGSVTNVELTIKLEGKLDLDQQKAHQLFGRWSAELKSALSFELNLPIKIKVELSIGLDAEGKASPGLQFVIFEF
jgi:hypothetical protein